MYPLLRALVFQYLIISAVTAQVSAYQYLVGDEVSGNASTTRPVELSDGSFVVSIMFRTNGVSSSSMAQDRSFGTNSLKPITDINSYRSAQQRTGTSTCMALGSRHRSQRS